MVLTQFQLPFILLFVPSDLIMYLHVPEENLKIVNWLLLILACLAKKGYNVMSRFGQDQAGRNQEKIWTN